MLGGGSGKWGPKWWALNINFNLLCKYDLMFVPSFRLSLSFFYKRTFLHIDPIPMSAFADGEHCAIHPSRSSLSLQFICYSFTCGPFYLYPFSSILVPVYTQTEFSNYILGLKYLWLSKMNLTLYVLFSFFTLSSVYII